MSAAVKAKNISSSFRSRVLTFFNLLNLLLCGAKRSFVPSGMAEFGPLCKELGLKGALCRAFVNDTLKG